MDLLVANRWHQAEQLDHHLSGCHVIAQNYPVNTESWPKLTPYCPYVYGIRTKSDWCKLSTAQRMHLQRNKVNCKGGKYKFTIERFIRDLHRYIKHDSYVPSCSQFYLRSLLQLLVGNSTNVTMMDCHNMMKIARHRICVLLLNALQCIILSYQCQCAHTASTHHFKGMRGKVPRL